MYQRMSSCELYDRGLALKLVRMFHPAIDDFQTAASDPQYAGKACMQMALCLRALGRYEEAVAAFQQAFTSPVISAVEQRHVLYQLGQTLEFLGRWAESLEVYDWISKGDPGFLDVAQRIKYVSSGKGRLYLRIRDWWGALVNGARIRRARPPHVQVVLDQAGYWSGWPAEMCRHPDGSGISSSLSSDESVGTYTQSGSPSERISRWEKLAP